MTTAVEDPTDNRMISEEALPDGDRIAHAREDLGMRQIDLRDALVNRGYPISPTNQPTVLSQIEHGVRPVPRLMRAHLNAILGIDLPRRPKRTAR